jgi:hypothetical protein
VYTLRQVGCRVATPKESGGRSRRMSQPAIASSIRYSG